MPDNSLAAAEKPICTECHTNKTAADQTVCGPCQAVLAEVNHLNS